MSKLQCAKLATVRRRPNLASRRKSGNLPGVVYMGEDWIGCRVMIVPLPVWRSLFRTLNNGHRIIEKVRKIVK